jgi:transcriptional regulator with XRE-family HTH domain
VDSSKVRGLRQALGLNQAAFGLLLGVGERTVIRLENDAGGDVEESVVRLLRAIGEARVDDAEGLLRSLLLEGAPPSEATARHEVLVTALSRIRESNGRGALRLKDLRVSRWVYWATGARADADETLALAKEGVICRQLRDPQRASERRENSSSDYPYLEQLRPGDLVLLCHLAEPLSWFELLEGDEPPVPVPSPVFRFVALESRLGQRLAEGSYRLADGSVPGKRGGAFSCLHVRTSDAKPVAPAPRGRGIRDTMTPFVERQASSVSVGAVSKHLGGHMTRVVGIDLASGKWADNGSALLEFEGNRIARVQAHCVAWPTHLPLTADALVGEVLAYCRANRVRGLSLDGPQGWRDPATLPALPGVGRRCEYQVRAQGKTGWLRTYPQTQRGWIEFCIQVFDELLLAPDVVLANGPGPFPTGALVVVEAFPTSIWRTAGLTPLPGKQSQPNLSDFQRPLADVFGLPEFACSSHDDLQAVVAALPAAALLGGPVESFARGVPAGSHEGRRIEGYIWDAAPLGRGDRSSTRVVAARGPSRAGSQQATVRVTERVLEQVNRSGDPRQAQIAIGGLPHQTATSVTRQRCVLEIEGVKYQLVLGDHSAFWKSHQTDETSESFERLFAFLGDQPGERIVVDALELPASKDSQR